MSNARIRAILNLHSVEYTEVRSRIIAVTVCSVRTADGVEFYNEYEDVTGWSRRQLYDWLGY